MALTNETISVDLGPVSAYAEAVAEGFKGTRAEWENYIANSSLNAESANANALVSEGYATGKQNGIIVEDDRSPYFENNAQYWAHCAQSVAEDVNTTKTEIENTIAEAMNNIPSDYSELSNEIEGAAQDETGQELLEEMNLHSALTGSIANLIKTLPTEETAAELLKLLQTQADRLDKVCEYWENERGES